jgi:hypothetical protein
VRSSWLRSLGVIDSVCGSETGIAVYSSQTERELENLFQSIGAEMS